MSNILKGAVVNPDKIYGKSAYEIAVMHGFEGTEEEWVKATDLAKEITLDSATKAQYYASLAESSNENAQMHETDARDSAREAQAHLQEVRNIVDVAGEKLDLLEQIPDDYITLDADVKSNTALIAGNKADIASNERAIAKNAENITRNSKRITNIEQGLTPDPFATDDSMAYQKDVPANALPYAEIAKIGGMTYKDGDTLRSAKVTEVKSVGVNLFDIEKREFGEFDENGDLCFSNVVSDFYRFEAKENTQYTLSAYVKNLNTTGNGRFSVDYTDGSTDVVVLLNPTTDWAYQSFTTKAGKTVKLIQVNFGDSGGWYIKGGELMINEGSTPLPYTPYVHHTLPIPVEVQALDGYGLGVNENCYNYISWNPEDNIKTWNKRVGVVDLGTLNWNYVSSYSYFECLNPPSDMSFNSYDYYSIGNLLCGKYPARAWDDIVSTHDNFIALKESYFAIKSTIYPDAATFKAAISGVMLVYELAEPIVTDISDLITADNLIGVEGGGTLTFENEYGYAVPSEVEYQVGV